MRKNQKLLRVNFPLCREQQELRLLTLSIHVLMRGNNRQDIFKEKKDYEKVIWTIKKYKEKFDFKLYHYVLMTNHVHLALEPSEKGGSLAQIMKGVTLSYAQFFKSKYRHYGHFWQDRYKSIIISKDEYLLACGSYVELNPVRAGAILDFIKRLYLQPFQFYTLGENEAVKFNNKEGFLWNYMSNR